MAADELGDVFDLGAVETEQDETPPFQFRIPGSRHVFTMPNMQDLPWQAQKVLMGQDVEAILRMMLSPDDWEEFERVPLAVRKVEQLLNRWADHNGLDLGESGASPPSSTNTAKRSRRTSATTTGSGSRASRRAR